jgi:hypothetical protein
MRPEELKAKVDEFCELIAHQVVELEEHPTWGSEVAREELSEALDELALRIDEMCDLLAAIE